MSYFVKVLPGQGRYDFVLIHNAGGNHQFFKYQVETLQQWGNVILIDLPGHGQSDAAQGDSLQATLQLVTEVCRQHSQGHLCLLGLNNGACLALQLAKEALLDFKKLILVDPPLMMDAAFIKEIHIFAEQLNAAPQHYAAFVDELVTSLLPAAKSEDVMLAKQAFLQVDKASLNALFASLCENNQASAQLMASIQCPTLCVITDEHHVTYQKVKDNAPQFHLGKVVGSSCWATLAVPAQLNAMIDHFMQVTAID